MAGDDKKTRKRNRVPISCIICRRRKVKCDKGKPKCQNCIKNGVEDKCHYIEPSWARDPEVNDTSTNSHANDETLKRELSVLKDRIKSLEDENKTLRDQAVSTSQRLEPKSTANNRNLANIPKDPVDTMDCIFNSNILFIAKKGGSFNFTITYQISTLSWMFVVKNDIYLNDLWMKILKLRHHYEFYYTSKSNSLSNSISENYKHYNYKLNKIHGQEHLSITSREKTNEHNSNLKNFLERTLHLPKPSPLQHLHSFHSYSDIPTPKASAERLQNNQSPMSATLYQNRRKSYSLSTDRSSKTCPVLHRENSAGNYSNTSHNSGSHTGSPNFAASNNHYPILERPSSKPNTPISVYPLSTPQCPVVPHNDMISNNNSNNNNNNNHNINNNNINNHINDHNNSNRNMDNSNLVFTKCPVLHPNDVSLAYVESAANNLEIPINANGDAHYASPMYDPMNQRPVQPEETKVCPLMIGDAKALFKEKLSKMNTSAVRDSVRLPLSMKNSPIPHTPPIPLNEIKPEDTERLNKYVPIAIKPESRSNSIKRTSSTCSSPRQPKKLKTISPSAIKSLNYNNTKQVISVIEQYLPNRKIVWLLIDRFFEKLYVQMPYIDEQSFRLRLASIINTPSNDERINLSSIGTRYCEEFFTICLMLIIIRLSWLSLPTSNNEDVTPTETLLMKPEHFVTLVLVDMVKEIFSSAKLMNKPSLIIFQVGLYLKLYNVISPEDGFDLDDSYTKNSNAPVNGIGNGKPQQPSTPNAISSNDLSGDLTNEPPNINSFNFNAMLVQLAFNIGLNRDPLNFKNFYPSQNNSDPITDARLFRKRHLWRKLWYGLVCIVTELNLSLGDYKKGLLIEFDYDAGLNEDGCNRSWDCRIPGGIEQGVLERSYDNGKALQRELCVVQIFRESMGMYKWVYKGLKILESTGLPPLTKDIEVIINKLNEFVCEKSKYGYGMDVIIGETEIVNPFSARNTVWIKKYSSQIKLYRLKVHLVIKNILFVLNYLVFLNHEQKLNKLVADNQSGIDKIERQRNYIETFFENTLILALDNYKVFNNFNNGSKTLFNNYNSELIFCPYLLILNHRSFEFLISLILRLQQQSPVIMEILNKNNIDPDELTKRLFTYLETFINKLNSLTSRYYYAWGLEKLVKLFHKILSNSQKFFNINFKKMIAKAPAEEENYREMSQQQQQQQQQQHHQQQQQQQYRVQQQSHQQNINHDIIKEERHSPKNAFEIAFGTSRLPPVTDFTQAMLPKEVPINLNQPQFPVNQFSAKPSNHYMSVTPSRATELAQTPNDFNMNIFGGTNFNELLDDHFINELGGFAGETFEDYSRNNELQLRRFSINNNANANEDIDMAQAHLVDPNLNNGALKRNSMFNSLYEIDFTNVDLNSGAAMNGIDYETLEDNIQNNLPQWGGLFEQ